MRLGRRSMALEAENALLCCLFPLSEAVSISVPAGQEIKSGNHGFSRQPGTRGQSCKDSVWVNKEARSHGWQDRTAWCLMLESVNSEETLKSPISYPMHVTTLQIPQKVTNQPWFEQLQSCIFTETNFHSTSPNTIKTFLILNHSLSSQKSTYWSWLRSYFSRTSLNASSSQHVSRYCWRLLFAPILRLVSMV